MNEPHYQDNSVTLYHGDCLDVLRELPDNSVDAVITDPPYGIAFMGKAWDQPGEFGSNRLRTGGENKIRGHKDAALNAGLYDLSPAAMANFQRWCTAWASECLRILKPGGHLLAFGGSRTWHRLAAAIEDAGFEIRDSIAWLYGSGFPKSLDVSKAIDKAAGVQREIVGTTRGKGGQNLNVMARDGAGDSPDAKGCGAYGQGAIQTDIDLPVTTPATDAAKQWQGWGTALKPAFEPIVVARKPLVGTVAANVLEHGTGALNIDACRIQAGQDYRDKCASVVGLDSNRNGAAYGEWTGERADSAHADGRWPTNVVLDEYQAEALDRQSGTRDSGGPSKRPSGHYDRGGGESWLGTRTADGGIVACQDAGGASRFFPVFRYEAKAPTSERPHAEGVQHPTVKPLDLMRWLVRLVTPVGAVMLEPFAGSGTTAEACVLEDRRCIAIEREADYLPLIVSRLQKPVQPSLFGLEAGA